MSWSSQPIEGLLLDITGVLYNSNGANDGTAIVGSVKAVERLLNNSSLKMRFVSNESSNSRKMLTDKLRRIGFVGISPEMIFSPAPASAQYLKENGLRPHLRVHPNTVEEFAEIDQSNPNCLLIGDAPILFTYQNLNLTFQLLMSMDEPKLITLGYGKYYMEEDGLKLDVGAFAKALEFACDLGHSLFFGKPNEAFFSAAIKDMGLDRERVVMIGDDIFSDVDGAQKAGIRALQTELGITSDDNS